MPSIRTKTGNKAPDRPPNTVQLLADPAPPCSSSRLPEGHPGWQLTMARAGTAAPGEQGWPRGSTRGMDGSGPALGHDKHVSDKNIMFIADLLPLLSAWLRCVSFLPVKAIIPALMTV